LEPCYAPPPRTPTDVRPFSLRRNLAFGVHGGRQKGPPQHEYAHAQPDGQSLPAVHGCSPVQDEGW